MAKTELAQIESGKIDYKTLDSFVGYHMKRAFNVVQADLSQALKPFELRMLTYTALVLIVDNPGLSQTQLAIAMDVERTNLVLIVDELENRRFIIREQVPTDKRAYALKVTLVGRRLCQKAVEAVVAHEVRLFSSFNSAERKALLTALTSLT